MRMSMNKNWNGNSESSTSYCWREKKRCVSWVDKYFKDCLCNIRDEISFACGILSLLAWGVAEVPQIITNFRTKSSHGVSLFFLLTWVLGDIFNLVGCLLEPSTLPTQFYTALLYTISTTVLVLQSLYYDHFYSWWTCRHNKPHHHHHHQPDEEEKKALNPKPTDKSGIPIPSTPVRERASPRREFYYTSARSLAGSDTPPFRSYLPRSGPSAVGHDDDSSSEDEDTNAIPTRTSSQARQIPRPGARGAALAAASVSLPIQGNAFFNGRRRLNEHSAEHNAFGQWLGWVMAAIYMGGRFPQIVLNIKRGSVEGLNPLMFIFALLANVAYVGSILVRTTEWERIKANMPWLLDAVVCVILDLFIIMQYVYYKYVKKKNSREDEFYCEEVGKAVES